LTISLAPLSLAAAAESDRPASPAILKAAVAKAASVEALASTTAAQPAQPAGAPNSRAFFKTPLGMAVIAIVGAGTAYAVYSAQHDRIHSAVR
jgi:hypothetical protein